MGFYGSNDPTNNVKALKEDRVLRIRLQSHQVHPTTPTIIQQLCSMKQTQQETWSVRDVMFWFYYFSLNYMNKHSVVGHTAISFLSITISVCNIEKMHAWLFKDLRPEIVSRPAFVWTSWQNDVSVHVICRDVETPTRSRVRKFRTRDSNTSSGTKQSGVLVVK